MKDIKLVVALKTLDKQEWISFRKYLLGVTGVKSEIFLLFSALQAKKSDFDGLKSSEVFRGKNFPMLNQKAFSGMISKLYKHLENWMSIYEFKQTSYEQELSLIKALFNRGLNNEAKKKADKLKRVLKSQEALDFSTNRMLAKIEHLIYFNDFQVPKEERNEYLKSASLLNAVAYKELSTFYIAELINRTIVREHDLDEMIGMLQEINESIPNSELSELVFSIIKVFQEQDAAQLDILISALLEGKLEKGSELQAAITVYVTVSLKLFYERGLLKNVELLPRFLDFELQTSMENTGGTITTVRFHNKVDGVANFLSGEKAIEFIETWIDKVDTTNLEETKNLAYAQVYFIKREFNKMMEFSRFNAFDNYGQKTRAWLHSIICLFVFRKENYNLAKDSLILFKKYIKRNENFFSKNFYQAIYNLIELIQKLIKNDFEDVEINLDDYKFIFYRNWITEEVEKIKKK